MSQCSRVFRFCGVFVKSSHAAANLLANSRESSRILIGKFAYLAACEGGSACEERYNQNKTRFVGAAAKAAAERRHRRAAMGTTTTAQGADDSRVLRSGAAGSAGDGGARVAARHLAEAVACGDRLVILLGPEGRPARTCFLTGIRREAVEDKRPCFLTGIRREAVGRGQKAIFGWLSRNKLASVPTQSVVCIDDFSLLARFLAWAALPAARRPSE